MTMRRLIWIVAAVGALTATGLAVAHGIESKSVKAVSATFTATTASVVSTSTCTGSDGTYARTRATYTGTSTSGEPSLNGAVWIRTESLINTTTNLGLVSGQLRFGDRTGAQFDAVYSNGNLVGLATGHTNDPDGRLLANLSAGFSTAGGFTNGKLGGGTSGGDAVSIFRGGCKPVPPPKPEKIVVHGAVTAYVSASITVAGVTCAIPADLQTAVAGLGLVSGTRVEMTCTVAGGVNTLSRLSTSTKGHHDVKADDRKDDKKHH
jgi:hypothetical protein